MEEEKGRVGSASSEGPTMQERTRGGMGRRQFITGVVNSRPTEREAMLLELRPTSASAVSAKEHGSGLAGSAAAKKGEEAKRCRAATPARKNEREAERVMEEREHQREIEKRETDM
jgi:hypothetical protein